MPETFCLRLAAGLTIALLILPPRAVSPRFFRSLLLIALCLLVTAGILAWNSTAADSLLWGALGSGVGLTVMAFWFWSADSVKPGVIALAMLMVTLLLACGSLADMLHEPWTWPLLNEVSSAAFLGTALTAMLLGHWYLIAPTMAIAPLLRLLGALGVADGVRLAVVAMGSLLAWSGGTEFDRLAWLWLAVRWLAGLLAPLGLIWMAWQSARIRSTQSATGILYVVVIFVFFGELTDLILQGHLATLAGGTR